MLTEEHCAAAQASLAWAVEALTEADLPTVRVAQYVAPRKRLLLTQKARFEDVAWAWPLGVLLLTPEQSLMTIGETTRAVAPGYPGHVSAERERRRELTRVASESGFTPGEVIYFDSEPITLEPGEPLAGGSLLSTEGDTLMIRWNPRMVGASLVPFGRYLREQVSLRIEHRGA